MKLNKKAGIFDLGGVICSADKFRNRAWKALADRLGICFDDSADGRNRDVSRMASLEIVLEKADKECARAEKEAFAAEKNGLTGSC